MFPLLADDRDAVVAGGSSSSTALPRRYYYHYYQVATPADVVVCTTYLAGVTACFLLSTGFHTLMAHSEAVYLAGMKLDVQGVLVLMWGATVPLVHYVFPCDAGTRLGYWALCTALAGACSAVTFWPRFDGPHLGPCRAALFGAFGAGSFALPIAHGIIKYGVEDMWARVGLGWILATVVCNGLGVGVYAMKVGGQGWLLVSPLFCRRTFWKMLTKSAAHHQFPERWAPRRFDLLGASHQLMHILVVAAALTYASAVAQAFDYRHQRGLACGK